jgi:hypothetical protein
MISRDLFSIDLDTLTFDDIVHFTGVTRPENERPQEGVRLDYKVQIPEGLGDDVTAFANTYGGIIILGVEADKIKQNIAVRIPGIQGKPDIKSTVVNKILSTIYPRPPISVGVIVHNENPDHVIVVIRVDESLATPHMFIAGRKNRISIREGDNNNNASLQQIEALFKKKEIFASEDFTANRIGDLYIVKEYDGQDSRSGNEHLLTLLPLGDLKIRLDRRREQKFEKDVKTIFYRDKNFDISQRHAKYYQIEERNKDKDYHRAWRLNSFGGIEFISQIGKGIPRQENLGDMLIDTLMTMQLYRTLLEEFGHFGRTYVGHKISVVEDTQLLPKMPPPGNTNDYDNMPGIHFDRDIISKMIYNNTHMTSRYADFSDIEKPEEMIAESFLEHLRMIFHGNINFDKLLESIQLLKGRVMDNKIS